MENVEYKLGDEISKGSFTGTFVKMANCDNQIYDFWDDSGHQSYNDCPNDTKMAWILIDREVGAVWVCPVCEDDGGYTGKIDIDAEESFAGLCEVCGNHTVSAPNRSEVVCTFCPAVVA